MVAMAATFGAATRAPFAAIVFVFELTHDFNAILPLMGATVLAEMIARSMLRHSLMTEKLARRNISVPSEYLPDVLATTRVGVVMTSPVTTLSATLTLRDAAEQFIDGRHSAYPIVDAEHHCVGMVSRSDLLASSAERLNAR